MSSHIEENLQDEIYRLSLVPFVSAVAVAAYFIYADFLQPWSAACVVLAYGAYLYVITQRKLLPPTAEIKDSPYYLGFLLTLVALLFSFLRIKDAEYLLNAVGSAISTTLVGLVFRSILHLRDQEDLVQKQIFAELQEDIKRSATGYKRAQQKLIEVIESFVNTREELLERDKQATLKYLIAMEDFLEQLRTLQAEYFSSLSRAVEEVTPKAKESVMQIEDLNKTLVALKSGMSSASPVQAIDSLRVAANQVALTLKGLCTELESSASGFKSMHSVAGATEADLRAIDHILSDFIETAKIHIERLEPVQARVVNV